MNNNFIDNLKEIYNENIQWLNFAELKNGALLTLVIAILNIVAQANFSLFIKNFFIIYLALIALICLSSFIPFLNKNRWIRKYAINKYTKGYNGSLLSKNIIFYIEIFIDGKEKYRKALREVLNKGNSYTFSTLEENYIEQIIQISAIASIKYYIFKIAIELFSIMSLLMIVCIIIA